MVKYYPSTTVPRNAVIFRGGSKYGSIPAYAIPNYFASTAWCESEEKFNQVIGRSFGWHELPTGDTWCNDRSHFRAMTQEEWDKLSTEYREEILKQWKKS